MLPFIHLHVHTQFSVLDGQASVPALVDKAIEDGMPGLAITDHGNMFGIKEFYNYAKKKNGKVKDQISEAEKALKEAEEKGRHRSHRGKQTENREPEEKNIQAYIRLRDVCSA